ncbi:collagen alpha-1(I) chain-like [Piliocolobus tephrosceles]|uniref:collagen alpha-1(I) chain-like n=1 Tax=Piliocolobus tephrosceles TaxID=591936 RepID=UPI000C2AEE66|nr:collagen alpha-1(I) chain-like [Piliocolobus tephrosceles]
MAASGPGGPEKTPEAQGHGQCPPGVDRSSQLPASPSVLAAREVFQRPDPTPLGAADPSLPSGASGTLHPEGLCLPGFPGAVRTWGRGTIIRHTPDPNRPKARRSRVGPEALILPAQGARPKVSTRSPGGTAVCRSPEAPNNDSAPESGHQAPVPCEAASTCLGSFQGPSEGPVTAAPSHSPGSWGPALLWIPARQQPACGLRRFRSCCTTGKGLEAGSWRWPQRRLVPSPPGQPSSPGHEGLRLTPRRKCPVLRESSEGLPAGNQDPAWPKPGPATMVRQDLTQSSAERPARCRGPEEMEEGPSSHSGLSEERGSQYLHISGRKGPEALGSRGCALRKQVPAWLPHSLGLPCGPKPPGTLRQGLPDCGDPTP